MNVTVDPTATRPGLIFQAESSGDARVLQMIIKAMRLHYLEATANHGFLETVRVPIQLLPPALGFCNVVEDRGISPDTGYFTDDVGRVLCKFRLVPEDKAEKKYD